MFKTNPYHFKTVKEMLDFFELQNYGDIFFRLMEQASIKEQVYDIINTSSVLTASIDYDTNIISESKLIECLSKLKCDELSDNVLFADVKIVE